MTVQASSNNLCGSTFVSIWTGQEANLQRTLRVPAKYSKQRIQPHYHYQFPVITKHPRELPTQMKVQLRSLHIAENATILFVDTKDPTVHMLNVTFVPTMSAQ